MFRCTACEATAKPKDALPASPSKGEEFNERVGLDVKYLPGWQPNQKIPCVNIVDYGSSFQQMVPLYARETGETRRQAYRQFWLIWAGIPRELILDPSKPNLAEALLGLVRVKVP